MKCKTAFLGGSFDPPHLGHENLFHQVAETGLFSNLILIPAYISNFKQDKPPLDAEKRIKMLNLALLDYKEKYPCDQLGIEISGYEIEKRGVSYTSLTAAHFFPEYEDGGKLNWIIGDDIIDGLSRWHDSSYIKKYLRFFCFSRYNEKKKVPEGFEVHFIASTVFEASSSAVREGHLEGLSKRVKEYIENEKLY